MYNLAICLTYFVEMLISYNFFSQIGEQKKKHFECLVIGTILFESGALLNIALSNTVWLNTIYFALINIAFAFLLYRIKSTKIIFYSIILDVFNAGLEFAAIFLISTVTKTQTTDYIDNFNLLLIDAAISKTLYFLTCLILARLTKKEIEKIKMPIGLYFYPIVIVASLLTFWSICAKSNISDTHQLALSIISFALFLSIVILFIIYQHNIEKENHLFLLQNENDHLRTENKYYDILEKQNEELMIYAHDTKKHLSAIQELSDDPRIDEYISKMTTQLKTHSNMCHSGYHALDVILNKYATECQIKDIDFSFDVKLSNLNYVDNYDLVTILGNLLDNAIEAVSECENKSINLVTDYRNTYDVLVITNTCKQMPNPLLITTKKAENFMVMG